MMPLGIAPLGKKVTISEVLVDDSYKKHFNNLGIIPGQSITLSNSNNGDLIVKIKEGRIAINKGLSMKIMVE